MAYKRRLKFDKRIRFKKKMDIMYILLLIVFASIGTGYAYIKSDLNVNGGANFNDGTWGCSVLSAEGTSHCGAVIES